jgi:hypothetical protein
MLGHRNVACYHLRRAFSIRLRCRSAHADRQKQDQIHEGANPAYTTRELQAFEGEMRTNGELR